MKGGKTNLKQLIRIFIIAKMFAIAPPLLALITLGVATEIIENEALSLWAMLSNSKQEEKPFPPHKYRFDNFNILKIKFHQLYFEKDMSHIKNWFAVTINQFINFNCSQFFWLIGTETCL
jgi:hypothetical protein